MAGGARSRPVTIIDVARHAGVSKSVVSRVLRDSGRVSPSTREAVLASIAELGYRPNAAARHLVQQRSHMVGVVVSDLHNVLFAEILDGVDEAASTEGFTVLVASGKREEAAEQHALEALLELRVECIILAGTLLSARSILAASEHVPTAIAGGSVQVTGVDSVRTDNLAGARLAVEHLAALGHSRIALIGGPSHLDAKERRAGYLRTMDALGLGAHAQFAAGDFTELGGYQGAQELLSRGERPTAILASNDLAAVGAMIAIQEAGLQVPADVSLVGFDNTALAALRQISLTTIDQPGRETGLAAMRAVLHRIGDRRGRARRVLLAPTLVVRSTTARPGKPSALR